MNPLDTNTNIPHGYTDEGERGISAEQVEILEGNWENILQTEAYSEKQENTPRCYNCDKGTRREGARIVSKQLVCEDCYTELNLEKKSDE